jgi:glycosyltransferase involved in cell wall biosynthesis
LNHYVKGKILPILDSLKGATAVIPFGVDVEFVNLVRPQKSIDCFSIEEPFRILYVSTVDTYKHQWHVARAVANLRLEGYPLELNLVGPAYARSLKRLTQTMKVLDPSSEFIRYFGHVPLRELHDLYKRADMKVFASSCEALPNILIEAMAAGLPIACSNRGPMPEVLGDAGVYFDPENVDEIGRAIRQLIDSPELRARNANMAFERAQQYSWQRCADETFSFFAKVVASARVEAV